MSKQRYLDTKFWDDSYIINKDPIEKLLFIYLLTNPLTNILGIYEISLRRIAFDTGIEQEMVLKILERFEQDNKVKYHKGYIALKNFTKYQKNNPSINKGIEALINEVPLELLNWINIDKKRFNIPNNLIQPVTDCIETVPYLNTNININTPVTKVTRGILSSKLDLEAPIIYLNEKTKRKYDPKSEANKNLVRARYNEGRSLDDFKKVIDKKCRDWLTDGKMLKYLRPSTLFNRTNFENYINEPEPDPYEKYYRKE